MASRSGASRPLGSTQFNVTNREPKGTDGSKVASSGGTRALNTAPSSSSSSSEGKKPYYSSTAPAINAPTGGGALKSIEEKFDVNPVSGTCTLSIPFAVTPGRNELGPDVSLAYDSGSGNGPFGLGWSLSLPSISRKTATGLPKYDDIAESDVFLFTGAEDLVPKLADASNGATRFMESSHDGWTIRQYWPRTEGSFTRIERWSKPGRPTETYWRTISANNLTSLYGQSDNSKLFDKSNDRVFAWLLCATYDSHGNAMRYAYKEEDSVDVRLDQAHEKHRTESSRAVNRYIKSIKYGNLKPNRDDDWNIQAVGDNDWMFEVVFDYGDHTNEAPSAIPDTPWPVRQDPFSTYAAGFEVRTYRLCRRILLFHHLKAELRVDNYLVKSMKLAYDESESISVLTAIEQSGHAIDALQTLKSRSCPPMEFEYSVVDIANASMESVPSSSIPNTPTGISSPIQWADLDGTGKSEALILDNSGCFRMRNRSTYKSSYHNKSERSREVKFAPAELLRQIPSVGKDGKASLLDLDGSGRLDVVRTGFGQQGFYERTDNGGWTEFTAFPSWPTVDMQNPNMRYLDLTGNGLADIVISEADTFLWYPALGTAGYGEGIRTTTGFTEDEGPKLLFSDGLETIYLADFSGDGLVDIVRIRNGQVCYWPNIGYGRFGARITMDNPPLMSSQDEYNPNRIQLADIDGSGVADILYFPATGGLKVYFNLSGNGFGPAVEISFPLLDSLSQVSIVDLFGLGVSSLVWSSSLPGSKESCLQYLDFTEGLKPHLLTTYKKGPIETRMEYKSSVAFYEEDESSGRLWPTRLPFPVQCLSQVKAYDYLSQAYTTSTYRYHDGYFDGLEREFRGFGKVETVTSEHFLLSRSPFGFPSDNEVSGLTSPPTLSVAWFHTGSYESAEGIRKLYQKEYFQLLPSPAEFALSLKTPAMPDAMRAKEVRQAYRALKGTPLHTETYSLDGSDQQGLPLTVSDSRSSVEILQSAVGRHPGVFLISPTESITCQVERSQADAKISHNINLEIDAFGNITKSLSIMYGRRESQRSTLHTAEDWKAQGQSVLLYTEQDFTNSISTMDDHHIPVSSETRSYDLRGLSPSSVLFTLEELMIGRIHELPLKSYTDDSDTASRRLISRSQTRYRSNDLSNILDPGVLESLAIPGETYTLAMTQDVLQEGFNFSAGAPDLRDTSSLSDKSESGGGYVDLESNNNWWIPSGQQRFSHDKQATPAAELKTARGSFFQPVGFIDPFGNWKIISYDPYFMFPTQVVDAVGNTKTCVIDYRTFQPRLITDENDNQTSCTFDVLGQCVGVAIMGKPGNPTGDSLDGFQPFWEPATLKELRVTPLSMGRSLISKCTSFSISDFPSFSPEDGWSPAFTVSMARETYVADLLDNAETGVQLVISYYDGRGQVLQTRTLGNTNSGSEQWLVDSWALSNSAGSVVRQYDGFFDESHAFGRPSDTIFTTNFYDPTGRLVTSVLPNHTWTKNVFHPWSNVSYDAGDNVLAEDPLNDPEVGRYLACLEDTSQVQSTWYARLKSSPNAADQITADLSKHYANTPTTVWLDALGQPFLSIADNGPGGTFVTRTYSDVQGRAQKVVDSEGRLVSKSTYDLVGTCIHSINMDSGHKWLLNDVTGSPIRNANSRGIKTSFHYDELRRPTRYRVQADGDSEFTSQVFIYGEGQSDPTASNLRGRLYQVKDQATVATSGIYDHLGNALEGSQEMVKEYKANIDWSKAVEMENEKFTWTTGYDALGRMIDEGRADGSRIKVKWDQLGLLNSFTTTGNPGATGQIIKNTQYNERGQIIQRDYSNGTTTQFQYDHFTSILISKKTMRGGVALQDLRYTVDCMGRILRIDDLTGQDIFFRGRVVKPTKEFKYDAIGRLVTATGREHLGQVGQNWTSIPSSSIAGSRLASPSDGKAMANYTEEYQYTPEGNILLISHQVSDTGIPGWTRTYQYTEPSLLESGKHSNRLSSTTVGGTVSTYNYDGLDGKAGLITSMSGFPILKYDIHERLLASSTQVVTNGGTPETTWYRYDMNNKRVRKVTERFATAGEEPVRMKDHLYINEAEMEVFRKFDQTGQNAISERWTWHFASETGVPVAMIEANKMLEKGTSGFGDAISLYIVTDHLSSASLELDEEGGVVSMEEFAPYGATTYDATTNLTANKRYRFSAKERDSETGLYYCENRYLMPWLGRWLSPDPIDTQDGLNVYCYVGCDPVNHADPTGLCKIKGIQLLATGARPLVPSTIKHTSRFQPDMLFHTGGSVRIGKRFDDGKIGWDDARMPSGQLWKANDPVFVKNMLPLLGSSAFHESAFTQKFKVDALASSLNLAGLPIVHHAVNDERGHAEFNLLTEHADESGNLSISEGLTTLAPCRNCRYKTATACMEYFSETGHNGLRIVSMKDYAVWFMAQDQREKWEKSMTTILPGKSKLEIAAILLQPWDRAALLEALAEMKRSGQQIDDKHAEFFDSLEMGFKALRISMANLNPEKNPNSK